MNPEAATSSAVTGRIVQIIGATIDAEFPGDHLPKIFNALEVSIDRGGEKVCLVCEVGATG